MKKDVLVLTCESCGEDFLYEYRGLGKKPKYCENCREGIKKSRNQEYMKKKRANGNHVGDTITLKCKRCGVEFPYTIPEHVGGKPLYCDECRLINIKEQKKRYREMLAETRRRVESKMAGEQVSQNASSKTTNKELEEFAMSAMKFPVIEEVPKEEVIVDPYTEFINKISKLLMTLDTTRVELCDLHKQMSEYQSAYDKSDQTYLHKLENIDTEDIGEMKRFVVEWKTSRGARRNVKDLITLVGSVIDAIPFKSYANALPVLKGSAFRTKI